jgi:hypothetical protein
MLNELFIRFLNLAVVPQYGKEMKVGLKQVAQWIQQVAET